MQSRLANKYAGVEVDMDNALGMESRKFWVMSFNLLSHTSLRHTSATWSIDSRLIFICTTLKCFIAAKR